MEAVSNNDNLNEQFHVWVNSLKDFERKYFFNKIALSCDVSYQTVYQWSIKTRKLRAPFARIINQVVGQEIIKI